MQSTFSSNICIDMNVLRLNQHFSIHQARARMMRSNAAISLLVNCNHWMIYSTMESVAAPNDCGPLIHGRSRRNSKLDSRRLQVCQASWSFFRAAKCCAIITQFRVASEARPFHVQPTDEVKFQWSSIDGVIDESSTSAARSVSISDDTIFARESFARVSAFSPITRPNIPSYLHQDWCLHKKLPRKKKLCSDRASFVVFDFLWDSAFILKWLVISIAFFSSPFSWQANNGAETTFDWCRHQRRYQSQRTESRSTLSFLDDENRRRTNYRSIGRRINITLADHVRLSVHVRSECRRRSEIN